MRYPKLLPLKSYEELEVEFHRRNRRTLRICPVLVIFVLFVASMFYAAYVLTSDSGGSYEPTNKNYSTADDAP